MFDIDMQLAAIELTVLAYLAVQLVAAAITLPFGYLSGRARQLRWRFGGFVLGLILALLAFGLTARTCEDGRRHLAAKGFVGPSQTWAAEDFGFLRRGTVAGVLIYTATLAGGGILHAVGRRRRIAQAGPATRDSV